MSDAPSSKGMLKGSVRSLALPNGFRVFAMRKPEAPAVTLQAWVATGSMNEGAQLGCGLSHFLEHMLFQGTKNYPKQSVADSVHRLGGDMNAYTTHNCTSYYISLPAKSCAKALDVLADMLLRPTLPEARFKLEKKVILRERDMNLDRPDAVLSEKLWQTSFLVHPARHPIIGYREKIEKVDRALAESYYETRYSPMRSFMAIVGDVDEDEALKMASDAFGPWRIGSVDEPCLPTEPEQRCRRDWTGRFKDPLARVSTAWRVPEASHPDIPALDMFSTILGGGPSSRLNKKLKTELELALDVESYVYAANFKGAAGFSAACPPEKLRKLEESALDAVKELRETRITESELARNVAQQSAEYIRSLASNAGVARIIGGSVMAFGSPDFADAYVANLAKLTPSDMQRVAQLYFGEDSLTVASLLPEDFKESSTTGSATRAPDEKPSLRKAAEGPRLLHFQDRTLPLVEFCAVLPAGTIWEPAGLEGASKTLAACLPCGTEKLSEDALAELFDEEAADFSAVSGNNTFCLRLNCPKERLDRALDAVAKLIAKPALPEKQFERERRNLLDQLASRKSQPQGLAEDLLCAALFGKHPYARPAGISEESLKALSAARLREFHAKFCLVPRKCVFGFAGDISRAEAFERMEQVAAACEWSENKEPDLPSKPQFPVAPSKLSERLEKEQAVILLGMPSCENLNDDREALELLHIASNTQASKLFKSLREDKGLAYYAGLACSTGIHPGYLLYYAGAAPATAKKAAELLDKERLRVAKSGLSEEEFEAARESLLCEMAEEMQSAGRRLLNSALAEFYGLGFMTPWERGAKIAKMKRAEVNASLAKYLGTESRVSVIVSPKG